VTCDFSDIFSDDWGQPDGMTGILSKQWVGDTLMEPSWQSFCSSQKTHALSCDFCLLTLFWYPKLHCDRFYWRLLPLRPWPTRWCSRLSQNTPCVCCSKGYKVMALSPLGTGGAGVHATCRRCLSSSSRPTQL